MNQHNTSLIQLNQVTKVFPVASGSFQALKGITLSVGKGQMVAITGKSGSGKSTLINIMSGIDKPSGGEVLINGIRVEKLPESELASWRGKNIGIVFQFFQLIPTLTIVENIMLPIDFCNSYPRKERRDRALALLALVDIQEQADKFPSSLSGGQQQRAAIARALANDPPVIIADEPTGNLDSHTGAAIIELFAGLAKAGKTVIIVTHEKDFASYFGHTISMLDGSIVNA